MSTNYDPPLSTQPDWQGHYPSFLPPGDNIFGQSYENVTNPSDNAQSSSGQQPRSAGAENASGGGQDVDSKSGASRGSSTAGSSGLPSPLSHRRSLDPLGLRQKQPSPIPERPESQSDSFVHKTEPAQEEGSSVPGISSLDAIASAGQGQELSAGQAGSGDGQAVAPKEEEDDGLDDEDMLEGDGEGEGGDGADGSSQPQTAAERTAQRRKMKRFRLTHQQTRFLMSEFAKQPHPDAAHRERLSREIPGLSPRQVQVWFQNRRAKIKRLTADDRDRMIKMRAVPDDFDNVQALHSPYGAVHALGGGPMGSPVDFAGSSYAEHMMRPLIVDVRRPEGDDHLSPTGLSPAFGNIGFNPSAAMSSSDILSPLSPTAGDRYGYPSHLSSPLSATARTSNPFARQNSLDTGMQLHNHHQRQQIRPLQPLQLRETMSRSRSDNLQSPLRSSMSWKGDSIDYSAYHHGGATSPQLTGRHQSLYQSDSLSTTATTLGGYESSTYSGSTAHSPTHMNYPAFQQSAQSRTGRLRAASASSSMQPLSLDLRSQYRAGQGLQQPSSHSASGAGPVGQRSASSTHHLGVTSSSSAYSSFPSAPLTAPIDFSLSRNPASGLRATGSGVGGQDFSIPQMSAPIAPPNDFSQAFHASIGGASSVRTPIRDSFGGVSSGGAGAGPGTTILHPLGGGAGSSPTGSTTNASAGDRGTEYGGSHHHQHHHHSDAGALKRKHSFSTSTSGAGSAYGSAA